MSLFSFNSSKIEKILLFDLKSESLCCSMVSFSKSEKPEILFYEKIEFGGSVKYGIKKYFSLMVDAFDKLSFTVRRRYLSPSGLFKKMYKVDTICINVSSPWILSKCKSLKVKKDKPFTIDEGFLSDVRTIEGQDVLKSSLPQEYKDKANFKIFEEYIIQTKLNGYKIEDIKNKIVSSFEANLFISIIQNDTLQKIVSSINKNIVSDKTIFHSFILSAFSYVRDAYPAQNDFVFLDIGAEVTEVCVAKDDAVEKIFTFPFGKSAIVKKISGDLKIPEEMALSLINMKCRGNCDVKTTEQVTTSMDIAINEWTNNLIEIFREVSPKGDIPKDVFIVSDDEISSIISKKIKESKLHGLNIVDNDFKITVLDNRKFIPIIKKQEISTDDVHQKLAIILIDKFLKNKNG